MSRAWAVVLFVTSSIVILRAQSQQQLLLASTVTAAAGITATNTGSGLCAGGVSGSTISLGTTAATGNFIIVVISQQGAAGVGTDSKGNTYTAITATGGTTPPEGQMFYSANAVGGSSHTVPFTGTFGGACAIVFTGLTSTPFNTGGTACGGGPCEAHSADHIGNTFQPGSVALASTPSLVVTMINGTAPTSIDSSFILSGNIVFGSGVNYPVSAYYKITSTTENPTVTLASSQNTTGQNAVFK